MKALVLGATGFLGTNLVRALLAQKDAVHALVRPVQSHVQAIHHRDSLAGLAVTRAEGDLGDPESLRRACQGIDVVYHCAGYYPPRTVPVQAAVAQARAETRNLLAAAGSTRPARLVFVSSLTTIGFPEDPSRLANEDCRFVPRFPGNPYLMAKIAMEEEVLEAARKGLPAVVVNPTACFGPYDSKPTSGTQVLMIAKRQMPGYIDGPTNAIDVRDVAAGMIRAAKGGAGRRALYPGKLEYDPAGAQSADRTGGRRHPAPAAGAVRGGALRVKNRGLALSHPAPPAGSRARLLRRGPGADAAVRLFEGRGRARPSAELRRAGDQGRDRVVPHQRLPVGR